MEKICFYLMFICVFTIGSSGSVLSQNIYWKYFKGYSCEQKETITSNWCSFFKEDIYPILSPQIDVFPLKIDSYGGFYPHPSLFKGFSDSDFKSSKLSHKNNLAYSMFNIFQRNKNKILQNLNTQSTVIKGEYTELFDITGDRALLLTEKLDRFYKKWNQYNDKITIDALKAALSNKKKVIFFIHGYNVPYSLANVQMIELTKLLKEKLNINTTNLLMVPIFWSSNSEKECNIKSEHDFSIDDKKNLNNGLGFLYYSNRAYFAAISLRKILNALYDDFENKEVLIFSHSLGTTISTTAIINTTKKLHYSKKNRYLALKNIEDFNQNDFINLKKRNYLNYKIIQNMIAEELPKIKTKVFLSAAAIPGHNTFIDMSKKNINNKYFYVTSNINDNALKKKYLGFIEIGEKRFGSTSLGLGNPEEITLVKELFQDNLEENIAFKKVNTNGKHNIFDYMQQDSYIELIKKWYFD